MDAAVLDLIKAGGASAVVGIICYLLLKVQMKEREEDRQWIRSHGESQMVTLSTLSAANQQITENNRQLAETNAKLVKEILEKSK